MRRFSSLRTRSREAIALALLTSGLAHAAEPPPPPSSATRLEESVVLPSTRARLPEPEPDAVKVRLNGEYELRQTLVSRLPLAAATPGAPREKLSQTSRLFHWLRLRGLALFGEHTELRLEADAPRGMVYGQDLGLSATGTDFERIQPLRVQPRVLQARVHGRSGELRLGHTTSQLGLGLVDADGDQARFFGTPERPATYEQLELLSGTPESPLRVGLAGDVLFDDGRLSLVDGDKLARVALRARYAPAANAYVQLLARYESLASRGARGGAQVFLLDASAEVRQHLPGRAGEAFAQLEAAYRVGNVSDTTAFAVGRDATLTSGAFAARGGFALEREHEYRRFAALVGALEWGFASGDSDPTDDQVHRFVMNPNHGVGLILFSEIVRFKTARAQEREAGSGGDDLATRGGVAAATYLNPVVIYRPLPDSTLKLGGVIASATSAWLDPSSLTLERRRANFDGGSPFQRSLGTEVDLGLEQAFVLDAGTIVRLSLEGAVAFPGSAFDDQYGRRLRKQQLVTAGVGFTF